MMADHLIFLRSTKLTSSKVYFDKFMEDWLRDWSFAHNRPFYDKVFANMADDKARHWNMPNTKSIRDQLRDLP